MKIECRTFPPITTQLKVCGAAWSLSGGKFGPRKTLSHRWAALGGSQARDGCAAGAGWNVLWESWETEEEKEREGRS